MVTDPMRFITFHTGEPIYGGQARGALGLGAVVEGEGVVDLTGAFGSLHAALHDGRLEEAAAAARAGRPTLALGDLRLAPTLPEAEKYLCIGVNYQGRNAEYKDGQAAPDYPSVFMRTRESFAGHGEPLIRPPESHQLDYEGEIAVVIGKAGRRIPRARAREHIAGLTLMNEGTLRDWVRHAKFNVTQGKNFERSGSIGPWMVPLTDAIDLADLDLRTTVNGEVRQDDNTSSMAFPIDAIVEYLSTFTRLQPGDVIATGTPNGAGARFDPPRYLAPGDMVEISCPAVGSLRNGVADETV